LGHGLGAKNPKETSYFSDKWIDIINKGAKTSMGNTILYTARGHGDSYGWQDSAESDLNQFTWNSLSWDMLNVSNHFGFPNFVAGGSSMGAATALYSAINFPDKVKGLIMVRPPTGWSERLERRKYLISSANKCKDKNLPGEKYHFVLLGAATSDFPSVDEVSTYERIICPTLILGVRNDDTHPESTAIILSRLINQSELYFVNNFDEAVNLWPKIIKEFLDRLVT
jgi:pimeloyl-ACP methyl ester carboxylesterase